MNRRFSLLESSGESEWYYTARDDAMVEGAGTGESVFTRGLHNLFCVSLSSNRYLTSFVNYILSLPISLRPKTAVYATADDPFAGPQVQIAQRQLEQGGTKTVGSPAGQQIVWPAETTESSGAPTDPRHVLHWANGADRRGSGTAVRDHCRADGRDTEGAPVPVEEIPQVTLKNLRIAFAPTFPGIPATAEIRAAVEALAKQRAPLCAVVEEATLPPVDFTQEGARAGALIGMMTGAFQPEEQERSTTLAHSLEALHLRDQSLLAWEHSFETWDLLLCPPSMVTAFPHCEPGSPLHVDGQDVNYSLTAAHGTVFNDTGHPAVVLP